MNKKRAILALGLVVSTVLLTVGATMALFTDTVEPAEADFSAGRLVITSERNNGDPVPGPCFYVTTDQGQQTTPPYDDGRIPTGVWAPGDVWSRTLVVHNNRSDGSTLHAWLTGINATLSADSDAILANKLYVIVRAPEDSTDEYQKVAEGYLSDFIAGKTLAYPGGSKVPCWLDGNRPLKFTVSFDSDAGNDYQGKNLVVDFTVSAQQMVHNP